MNAIFEPEKSITTKNEIVIRRLCPALGVEVLNFDVANCTDEQFATIFKAWIDANGLMVIRNVEMTPVQHIAFGARFGVPGKGDIGPNSILGHYYHPDHPEIYRVSNKSIDGKPLGREDAGTYWHSDESMKATPALASLLHAIEIPPYGGDTQFASMYMAYDTLSDTMKRMLHGLQAVHSLANTLNPANRTSYGKELVGKQEQALSKIATHPVVRIHPDSGRKCLFINPGFTSHIVGMTAEESSALLQFLFKHSTQPEFIYRHRYAQNDLVVWDNRCMIHYAISDYKNFAGRYMHRVTIQGEVPIGA